MPQRWKDMVDAIRKNLQGKTNPRTKKPYSESDIYAIAMAQYKKKYGTSPTREDLINMINEDNPKFSLVEYYVPIDISETGGKDFMITGTAVDASVSRNNVRYLPEELQASVTTLKGVPILDSHKQESVKNILGIVQDAFFDNSTNSVKFKGKIMDKEIQNMISDGRIRNVSIGARVKDLPKDEDSETRTAKGIEFLELSLVPIQGVKNATISQALFEKQSFVDDVENILKQIELENGEDNMTEEIKEVKNEEVEALKKQVEDYKVQETTMKKENEELKAQIVSFKKVDERLTSLENSLTQIIEKLNKPVEEKKEIPQKVEEKVEPKTVVETVEAPKEDDLVIERFNDGVSIWRKPNPKK